eukprot:CAMPEP_0175061788 /NCGR_PEP_ID=MMETSP0052_2-20121109/13785_1 /TAXON_ID=51329 ORGANISM="Polytomella parva, Strain SAG 63-3" /NCGR_SAMPLE_ID=MMETSP0052_2 /ASSEMBLY_ACC=CAM_ASM_000194 /LENGTH=87 /DNA_ID=CAMNT_0016327693 /DNA_START=116 /DNA_END=376 /DNA_ORIENTATION=+
MANKSTFSSTSTSASVSPTTAGEGEKRKGTQSPVLGAAGDVVANQLFGKSNRLNPTSDMEDALHHHHHHHHHPHIHPRSLSSANASN